MGAPKLALAFADGETLGARSWRALRDSGAASSLIAVVRPDDSLSWLPDAAAAEIAVCTDAADGMSRSIRCGMRAALRHRPEAVLIALADQPFIEPALYRRLVSVFASDRTAFYVASDYGSFSAPPALFAPALYDALETLEGDAGARKLLSGEVYRGLVVPTGGAWAATDIDTPADWRKVRQYSIEMFGN